MTTKFITVGEGLGKFENTFKIKLQEITEIDSFSYSLWELIKANPKSLEEIIAIDETIDANLIQEVVNNLLKKEALIEMPTTFSDTLFDRFSLVPKGQLTKSNNEFYKISSFPKEEPIEVPVVPYLIWMNAHPFISCTLLLQKVFNDSGIEMANIEESFIKWLPTLLVYDLVSLRPTS